MRSDPQGYEGSDDTIGSYVRYIQDNKILCFAHRLSLMNATYLQYKDRLKQEGLTLLDFASMVPFAVSSRQFARKNNDLVMSRPFEEPDEYFLRRQKEGQMKMNVQAY